MLEYICLLISIGTTVYFLNYKLSTSVRILAYQEEEEPKYAYFSFICMIISIFAWTTYFVCF